MADASLFTDRRSLSDRRFMNDRRTLKDSSLFVEDSKVEQIRHTTPFSLVFDFLCLMAVAVLSFVVYIATGFYNGVTSPLAHAILGGGMFIYFLIMFRRGLGLGIIESRHFRNKSN